MHSARAIHRAALAALEARFTTDFCEREPYRSLHPAFLSAVRSFAQWPSWTDYDALAAQVPAGQDVERPSFVVQDRARLRQLGGYEQHVAHTKSVPTRERSWHDFFNMSVWAHFPRVRWALNSIHVDGSLGPVDPRNGRAPAQNVAAQFDESGMIVASASADLLAELRGLRFSRVFWERREELLATTRFWIIGHGTLESLLSPHLGLATKAMLIPLDRPPAADDDDALRLELDQRVAAAIDGWRRSTPLLDPVPVLGIPGYADNARPEFYDDARYFRFRRRT